MNLEQRIRSIDTKLSNLTAPAKPRWVKVGFIQDLTGWTKEKMRSARQQSLVKYEKRADGIWYDMNSIPQQFIKNTQN